MVKAGNRMITSEQATAQQCCHHWIVEATDELTSKGVCKLCGEQKEFKNKLHGRTSTSESGQGTVSDDERRPRGRPPGRKKPDASQSFIAAAAQGKTFEEWLDSIGTP